MDLLIHSDGTAELYHWKYIKKEKIPGKNKFRYYYDLAELKEDVRDAVGLNKPSNEGLESAKRELDFNRNRVRVAKEQSKAWKESAKTNPESEKQAKDWEDDLRERNAEYRQSVRKYDNRKQLYDQAVKKYAETPIGKLENLSGKIKESIKNGQKVVSDMIDKTKESIKKDAEKTIKDTVKKVDAVYNNPDNIYDTNMYNYDKKIKEIEKSKEWQDIVKREDPEYVKTNEDGTKEYLIDDYLVKKKHPELDIISDLGFGRKVTVNKVTAESFVAGAKDYITSAQHLIGLYSIALTEKFKLSQGSYNEEVKTATKKVKDAQRALTTETNSKYTSAVDAYNKANNVYNQATSTANKALDTASRVTNDVSSSDELDTLINAGADYVVAVLREQRRNYNQ